MNSKPIISKEFFLSTLGTKRVDQESLIQPEKKIKTNECEEEVIKGTELNHAKPPSEKPKSFPLEEIERLQIENSKLLEKVLYNIMVDS